jgi:hypothetical protein
MRPFGEWASAEAYAETTANLVVGEFGFLLADREPNGKGWRSVVWQCVHDGARVYAIAPVCVEGGR